LRILLAGGLLSMRFLLLSGRLRYANLIHTHRLTSTRACWAHAHQPKSWGFFSLSCILCFLCDG